MQPKITSFHLTAASARPAGRRGAGLFFGAWLAATTAAGAWMLALGTAAPGTMPSPAVLRQARAACYVLGPDCGLSAAVAARLARHAPRSDLREDVWLTADDPESAGRLRAAGYEVGPGHPDLLPRRRPGPWLALLDGQGKVIFSGPFPAAWDRAATSPRLPGTLAALAPVAR